MKGNKKGAELTANDLDGVSGGYRETIKNGETVYECDAGIGFCKTADGGPFAYFTTEEQAQQYDEMANIARKQALQIRELENQIKSQGQAQPD